MSRQSLVDQTLHQLTSLTSRRGLLEAVGKGLIGAGVATLGLPVAVQAAAPIQYPRILRPDDPNCANCGGCGPSWNPQLCGTTGGDCCAGGIPCRYCGSGWCPTGGQCGCPVSNPATIYGWYWYCCTNGQLWECNDCCDPNTYACVCTNRCNTQLAC